MQDLAPSASARITSWPERMPPSNMISICRADRIDDLRQHLDRRRRAVELTAAMVGDHQRLRAGLRRLIGVLDVENALQDQLARPDAADPLDILPVQRGVELRRDPGPERGDVVGALEVTDEIAEGAALAAQHAGHPGRLGGEIEELRQRPFRRHRHAVLDVGMALPDHLQIDGQHQRAAFGRDGALDQRLDEAAVLHHVQLEPERLVDIGGDILDRADRHRAQRVGNAGGLRGAAGVDLAVADTACRSDPTGARISGSAAGSPRMVVERSRFDTSTRMRWRNLICCRSSRLARSVSSA